MTAQPGTSNRLHFSEVVECGKVGGGGGDVDVGDIGEGDGEEGDETEIPAPGGHLAGLVDEADEGGEDEAWVTISFNQPE